MGGGFGRLLVGGRGKGGSVEWNGWRVDGRV